MQQRCSSSGIGLYGDCCAVLLFFSILHFVFLTYELAVKFSVCIVVAGRHQAGKDGYLESGVARGAGCLFCSLWADLPVPSWMVLH